MKNLLLIPVLLLFIACQSSETEHTSQIYSNTIPNKDTPLLTQADRAPVADVPADQLLIPGEKVGQTTLGMPSDQLVRLLGEPDLSDAAMGKSWLTWNGKMDEHNNQTALNIYVTYADSSMREKVVKQIRTTSSFFKTQDALSVYSAFSDIQKEFPNLKKVGAYTDGNRSIVIYDDVAAGIAFETVTGNGQEICTGIIVHPKGKEVLDVYIYLHPGMKKV